MPHGPGLWGCFKDCATERRSLTRRNHHQAIWPDAARGTRLALPQARCHVTAKNDGNQDNPATAPAFSLLLALALSSAGCGLVEGVFKAGLWVGIILVLIVVGLVVLLLRKIGR